MAKRILKEIIIDEISAVDKPAQPGALASIMKRHDPKKRAVIGKNVKMTTAHDGHQHTIDITGWDGEHLYGGHTSYGTSDGDETGHSHPWIYDKSGGLVIGEALGHKHEIAEMNKSGDKKLTGEPKMAKRILKSALASALLCSAAITKFDADTAHEDDAAMIRKAALDLNIGGLLPTDGPLAKMGDKEEDEDDEAKKMKDAEKLKKFEAIAGLNGVQKSHYDSLGDDDARTEFLKMSSDDRAGEISKASENDPVIYKSLDGLSFRKSDDDRLVAMAKSNDAKTKDIAKAQADARDAKIEKRAAEFDQLPGKTDVKKALIGAIEDIEDKEVRKGVYQILKAANDAGNADFEPKGAMTKADVADVDVKLEKMVKAHASDNNVPYATAYMAVTKSGEGAKLYKSLRSGASAE